VIFLPDVGHPDGISCYWIRVLHLAAIEKTSQYETGELVGSELAMSWLTTLKEPIKVSVVID